MDGKPSKLNIKDWAREDRPREKLLLKGRSILTDAELIAILIGSGTPEVSAVDLAKTILSRVDHDLDALARLSVKDLMKFRGIGEAKAIAIVSALELGRRRKEHIGKRKDKISSSSDAYNILKTHLLDKPHEEFWLLLLNRANRVTGTHSISTGGVSGTVADPKIIFKTALENLASSIIIAHNHPSGNLRPSEADIRLTKKLREAGKTLDITLLDHLIVADKNYFSFADQGML